MLTIEGLLSLKFEVRLWTVFLQRVKVGFVGISLSLFLSSCHKSFGIVMSLDSMAYL